MKNATDTLEFFHDNQRHLVCKPFSVENLHLMARELGIKRGWFHSGDHPHYDIPQYLFGHIIKNSTLVSPREIYRIIHGDAMRTEFDAKVEIDHERGVIYVHVKHPVDMDRFENATPIRLGGLPRPIPSLKGFQLDLNMGLNNYGDGKPHANWRGDGIMTDNVHKDSGLVIDKVTVNVDEQGIASASVQAAKPLSIKLAEQRNSEVHQACINEGTHGIHQIPGQNNEDHNLCENCGLPV